jgi:uncharacterized protein
MIHTTEKIGPNKALTPEGFLLCRNVPIARTGTLVYMAGEIPSTPDSTGFIQVTREAGDVFAPSAIASFEGKPVTNLHPDKMVTPETWGEVVVGTVQNVHQEGNLLVADLLISQADAIRDVQSGLREVSCGYEAEYEQIEPGKARQRSIVGNHVALVPRGRCGSTCSIKDHDMKRSLKERLMAVFKTGDQATIQATLDSLPEDGEGASASGVVVNVASTGDASSLDARISALQATVDRLVKDADEDDEEKKKEEESTKDEDPDDDDDDEVTKDSYQTVLSKAAIIAPGVKLSAPTGDAKSATFKDALCGCKLKALTQAYATDAGKETIDALLSGRKLAKLKGASLDAVFNAASVLMAQHNNGKHNVQRHGAMDAVIAKGELLKANIAKMREATSAHRKF